MPVVLLSLREWDSYGYELMERTVTFGFEAMNPGTLYRTLRRMEEEGVVESSWDTSKGGPARRMYSITDAGEAYLGLWARALEQYQRNMDAFYDLYTGRPLERPLQPQESALGVRDAQKAGVDHANSPKSTLQ